jgi:molybdopterin/thiamine biosynthesis adenylyltransferase/rhodanese-related sulfurtransferase
MIDDFSQEELLRYARHLVLPEVGLEGQRKLKKASVLIVGTGGLGSPISLYLAAAGVGRIGLVDYDVVDASNLQRQIVHDIKHVGLKKVGSAAGRLAGLNQFNRIDVYDETFNSSNARRIAEGYDVLVDGTDNFPTRYLLNDLAVLTGKPYVYGSVFRFEGQVSVFDARKGPCYRCLFPQPPKPGMIPTSVEAGILGVIPGIIGTMEANEVLKLLLGIGEPLIGRLLLVDALEMSTQSVILQKNPACPVCGKHPAIKDLIDYEQFCGSPAEGSRELILEKKYWITPEQLNLILKGKEKTTLLDVRTPGEALISNLPGSVLVSLEDITAIEARIDPGGMTIVFCREGRRSARVVTRLVEQGHKNVRCLEGGINNWAQKIDPSMKQY